MSNFIRFFGDLHGNYTKYKYLIHNIDKTICIGDVGFNYSFFDKIDSSKHQFIAGNHDNRDKIKQCKNYLNDYGTFPYLGRKLFYCGGAWSIDSFHRILHELVTDQKIWWENEELSVKDLKQAVHLYCQTAPDIVFTHECPLSIVKHLSLNKKFANAFGYGDSIIKTRTNLALELMLISHQPKLWIFGHYHKDFLQNINGTNFLCINQNDYRDIYEDGSIKRGNKEIGKYS